MPRQVRLEYPGAIYYLRSRDDQREDIFLSEVAWHDLIHTLAEPHGYQDQSAQVHE